MRLRTYNQLASDLHYWEKLPYTGADERGHQRFGQYVWNKYDWPERVSWPELFYCENTFIAYSILFEYVRQQEETEPS